MNGAVRASIALETPDMQAENPAAHWPPRVGDYARERLTGALGEVVDVTCRGSACRYTLNLFPSDTGAPVVELGDLEAVWPTEAEDAGGRLWDEAAPAT